MDVHQDCVSVEDTVRECWWGRNTRHHVEGKVKRKKNKCHKWKACWEENKLYFCDQFNLVDLKQTARHFFSIDRFIWDQQRFATQCLPPWWPTCRSHHSQGRGETAFIEGRRKLGETDRVNKESINGWTLGRKQEESFFFLLDSSVFKWHETSLFWSLYFIEVSVY